MSKNRSASKTVSDIVAGQFEGNNSFYVINFHEGGGVIVSAENTTVPVLAFSIAGTYSTDDEKPKGLLLKDCGEASDMTYACAGSFTTDLELALISVLPQ